MLNYLSSLDLLQPCPTAWLASDFGISGGGADYTALTAPN